MTIDQLREKLLRDKRITLSVKAIPKSSRNEVVGMLEDGTIKVKITAAPERGKANAAICELLAELLCVAKRNVTVLHGEGSQQKQIIVSL